MGIKPALGWLSLLLFTTAAQAETASRRAPPPVTVTVKTKAPPPLKPVVNRPGGTVAVVDIVTKPKLDYEADAYAGAPLTTAAARELGLEGGLVRMVLSSERRSGYRIAKDAIRRVVRLASESSGPRDHIDVIELEDSVVLVDTKAHAGGMFVTSDVYAFSRGASLDQRVGVLPPGRDRLREALVVAEWTPSKS
jgi:hypothetical protein